jgi:branched-chain amino acid transport system permease protein
VEKRLGFLGASLVSPVAVALIGIVVERLFLSRLYTKDPSLGLLFTFGLAMTIEQSLRMIWGTTGLPFAIPETLRGVLHLGDFIYSYYRLTILAVAALAVAGCWLLLNRTAFGLVIRAGVRDPEMVRAMGISLKPALAAIFALGVGLAALSGVMSAPLAGVQPAMGSEILTATFVVVVIGGLGSFWGVVLAGLLVGVVRGVTVFGCPPMAEASMYLLMVLVLLFRPRGLLGERFERFE